MSNPVQDYPDWVEAVTIASGVSTTEGADAGTSSVGTSATEIVEANENRTGCALYAPVSNTDTVYVGPGGVAVGDGFVLDPGHGIVVIAQEGLYAIANSGTQSVSWWDE